MAEPAPSPTTTTRPSGISSRYLTNRDEIVRVLKIFRDQRADLQLRFEQDIGIYTAKVLDLQKQDLLLEDLQPRDGSKHLRARKPFSLSGRVEGIYIHCVGNVSERADSERGVPYFHVALPESLLYQQRRRAARFRLPLRVVANGAQVHLFRKDGKDTPLTGRIIDISAGGCRAELAGVLSPPLQNDEILEGCAISVPNLLNVHSKGAVRHAGVDEERQVTTCGIEFTEMHVTDRRRLEQFIQAIAKLAH
jgi:c-di-GMP-binding flagellar brake protein YcgR